jgi:hypothetical protein
MRRHCCVRVWNTKREDDATIGRRLLACFNKRKNLGATLNATMIGKKVGGLQDEGHSINV